MATLMFSITIPGVFTVDLKFTFNMFSWTARIWVFTYIRTEVDTLVVRGLKRTGIDRDELIVVVWFDLFFFSVLWNFVTSAS